jgi:hypothetical protein
MSQTIPLSVPDDLLEEVRETARATNLSVQDVFRQSTKLGLTVLRQSLERHLPRPKWLSAWDALRSGNAAGELHITPGIDKVRKVAL